jgi:uracil phosphoribosyltransferase
MSAVTVVDHALVQHKLGLMRRRETASADFRRLLREIAVLLAFEVTRDLPLTKVPIHTPLTAMDAPALAGKKLCLVPVLRAGTGMLDGMLDVIPSARVGHVGVRRDPQSLAAAEYCCTLPQDIGARLAIVLDPMLATGHSAIAALERLKQRGARAIRFVCLVAAPEGLKALQNAHPDVPIYTAAIDSHLNEHGYIIPGLGDAGDRLFGTK